MTKYFLSHFTDGSSLKPQSVRVEEMRACFQTIIKETNRDGKWWKIFQIFQIFCLMFYTFSNILSCVKFFTLLSNYPAGKGHNSLQTGLISPVGYKILKIWNWKKEISRKMTKKSSSKSTNFLSTYFLWKSTLQPYFSISQLKKGSILLNALVFRKNLKTCAHLFSTHWYNKIGWDNYDKIISVFPLIFLNIV